MTDRLFDKLSTALSENKIDDMVDTFNLIPQSDKEQLVRIVEVNAKDLFGKKQYTKAAEQYLQLVLLRGSAKDCTNYALTLFRLKEYAKCETFLLEHKASTTKWSYLYAAALCHQSKQLEALPYLEELDKRKPNDTQIQKYLKVCRKAKAMIDRMVNPEATKETKEEEEDVPKFEVPTFHSYDKLSTMEQKWFKESVMAQGLQRYMESVSNQMAISTYVGDLEMITSEVEEADSYDAALCLDRMKDMRKGSKMCVPEYQTVRRIVQGMIQKHNLEIEIVSGDEAHRRYIDYTIMSVGRGALPNGLRIFAQTVGYTDAGCCHKPQPVARKKLRGVGERFEIDWKNREVVECVVDDDIVGCVFWFEELDDNANLVRSNYDRPAFVSGNNLTSYQVNDHNIHFEFQSKNITMKQMLKLPEDIRNATLLSSPHKPVEIDADILHEEIVVGSTKEEEIDFLVHDLFDLGGLGMGVLHHLPKLKYRDIYPRRLKIWGCLVESRFDETLLNPYLWSQDYGPLRHGGRVLSEPVVLAEYDLMTAKQHEVIQTETNFKIIEDGVVCGLSTWYEDERGPSEEHTIRYCLEKTVEKGAVETGTIVNNSVEIFYLPKTDPKTAPPRFDQRLLVLEKENQSTWKQIVENIVSAPEQYKLMLGILERFSVNPRAFNILPNTLHSVMNNLYKLSYE